MSHSDERLSVFTNVNAEKCGNLTEEEFGKLAQNKERYSFIEVSHTNARQVKCFDSQLHKEVWGTYQEFCSRSKERIFVPNC